MTFRVLLLLTPGKPMTFQVLLFSTPVCHKDCIVVFMDLPRSGAHHRALAVVDSVCIDLNRADHAAPDKTKCFSIKSRLFFTFATPETQGLRYAS
jgi:hypothetical protein